MPLGSLLALGISGNTYLPPLLKDLELDWLTAHSLEYCLGHMYGVRMMCGLGSRVKGLGFRMTCTS